MKHSLYVLQSLTSRYRPLAAQPADCQALPSLDQHMRITQLVQISSGFQNKVVSIVPGKSANRKSSHLNNHYRAWLSMKPGIQPLPEYKELCTS